jgi:mannose-6-phosphate isomerase-like protein (cupin superfamily)
MDFTTKRLPVERDNVALDGSDVRVLLGLAGGGMAHFELGPGHISGAVAHRSVEEIWYVVGGHGQMWRRQDGREESTLLEPGVCLTIPLGTSFQFRTLEDDPVSVIGVTMPPWPEGGDAYEVDGKWRRSG